MTESYLIPLQITSLWGGVKYEVLPYSYIYNETDNKYYQKLVAYGEPIEINDIDLNNEWVSDSEDSNYKYFKSNSNVSVGNSFSQCKVTWSNLTSITFKYMSSSEIGYDYLCVGNLDGEKFTSHPFDGHDNVYLSTKDKESGTYYEFTIECDEGEHHIWFCYQKDYGSSNEGEDRGFIGVPKSVISVLDIKQGSELPTEYNKYGGISAEGGKTYGIYVNNVTLPNGSIVADYENVEKAEKAINYEYVDLGLESGTLWAKCNIGATSETEGGVFFQWGETSGVSGSLVGKYSDENYTWASYKYCNGTYNTLTKYNNNTSYGENPDNITTLEPEDDAAIQIMGGDWRMPTATEYQTLYNETLWVWCPGGNVGIKKTDESGNESIEYIAYPTGYFVFKTESDKNKRGTFTKDEDGNLIGYTGTSGTVYYPGAHEVTEGDVTSIADGDTHIFFPASGIAFGPKVSSRGSSSFYYSSSLWLTYSPRGLYLSIYSSSVNPQDTNNDRCYGYCVRGVCE